MIDARLLEQNKTIETDLCIVGAGTAGITLAREFIGQKFRVCLLESGGLKPDKETQALQWGKNVGHPYYSLDVARPRYLGGTCNRWHLLVDDDCVGARMRPLDEIDFVERDWMPYSGWPFPKSHLDPFYDRAQNVCKIEPSTFDSEDWEDEERGQHLSFHNNNVKTVIFKLGSRYPFVKDYVEQINNAPNISTYIHANVIEIETDETAKTVNRLRIACLNGKSFWVSARSFILSAGAIENARLLLVSNKVQKTGLGNQHDLVGRFFMEHPHCSSGLFVPSNQDIFNSTGLYNNVHIVNKVPVIGKLCLSEEVQRREKLLNHVAELFPKVVLQSSLHRYPVIDSMSVRSLRALIRNRNKDTSISTHLRNIVDGLDDISIAAYRQIKSRVLGVFNKRRIRVFLLHNMSEQVPNPESRVIITDEFDCLGLNRVALDWRLSHVDIHNIIRTHKILDKEVRRAGLGRIYTQLYDEIPSLNINGGWHHMGTTRMHVDPKKGVVDENCRVHEISNLFVAGPSVFPTGGYANPVLTIVALAIRLADRIKNIME